MAPKPSRDMLIHCDSCGEEYSSTYRRCPFCGARNEPRRNSGRDDPASSSRYIPTPPPAQPAPRRDAREEPADDGYIFDGQDAFEEYEEDEAYDAPRPKGGKRLAPKQSGGFDLPPVNWPRVITFLCSLIIIVAALVIVFTSIYPQLRDTTNPDPKPDDSAGVSDAPSQPPVTVPTPGGTQTAEPGASDPQPPESLPPAQIEVTGIALQSNGAILKANDITLLVGESAQLTAVVSPAEWSGEVTWTSSNPEWFTVNGTGLVTNVNSTGSYHNAFLTVTAGGMSIRCEVRVRGVSEGTTVSPSPSTQAPASDPPASQAPSGGPVVGAQGTIVGAEGGLRVRPDPSTSNPPIATLLNGNTVTVVADAGGGWYQISFAGSGGATVTGYIMGEYISSN